MNEVIEIPGRTTGQLSDSLRKVKTEQDEIILTGDDGQPLAAVVDIVFYERIKKLRANYQRASADIATAFSDMSENEKEKLIEKAVNFARQQ